MLGLDLFCGAGGASRGYFEAGFDMVGVDNKPQKNYPYTLLVYDAIDFLKALVRGESINGYTLKDFSFIHASPPCQGYSTMVKSLTVFDRPKLIKRTRKWLIETNKPYVIENVPGAPLIAPIKLCGTSFETRVRRHRLFESNVSLVSVPCRHRGVNIIDPVGGNNRFKTFNDDRPIERAWREEMGVTWMTQLEARQALPPVYTHFIGGQLSRYIKRVDNAIFRSV